jgi:peptide/nickel transport system permease protein
MTAVEASHLATLHAAPPERWAFLRSALRLRRTRVGLALLVPIVLIAVAGPLVAPHTAIEPIVRPYSTPSHAAPLGGDVLGRDVLSRLLWGGWSVVWMSVAATGLGFIVGISIGLVAGYARNWLDDVLIGAMDVLLAFPAIVMTLLFVSMLGPKLWLITAIVALTHAPRVARLTRGITLEVAQREFIEAAEVIGVPRWRILINQILPNLTTPLTVEFTMRLTWSIGVIAAMSFLGYGIQPPNADWGLMINENRQGLVIQPWAVLAPIALIAAFAVGTNLIGEGLARAAARDDADTGPASR